MRYSSRILILFSIFLLVPLAYAKSDGYLAGSIKSVSGNPLRDAVIKIFRELQQREIVLIMRSDKRGFFKSAHLTPGTYSLEVSRPGYQPLTSTKFAIDPGQTTSLNIILQDIIGLVSKEDDPRNWDLKTVMRSTSDRRLIFRDIPGSNAPVSESGAAPFSRGGAMEIASGTSLSGEGYMVRPQASHNGVSSNFALTEPTGQHSRMILSGQVDFGNGTFWRLRNTYNFRPDNSHDYKVSVGYGRMNEGYLGTGTISSEILSEDASLRESGVETLAFGVEGNTKLLDLLAIKYGFDYSRLHYGFSKSFFYPSIQILFTPSKKWNFQTSFTSQRVSDIDTIVLPDGELLNLSEPTILTVIGNQVSMSQIRHSEIAAQRRIGQEAAVEIAVFQDQTQGPGLPLMVTTITPLENKSDVIQMNESNFKQRGARLALKQRLSQRLSGSLAYVYGNATCIPSISELVSSEVLNANLADYMQQRYQHSVTGQIDTILPVTNTSFLTTMRWYSGNPLTPVDWFSDRMDIATKSVNFEIRQSVPLPYLIGTTGQWDVWVDFRNVFNQGKEILPATDGEVVINRNPRSLRFGISLNFQ
ncbi:MAG: carboxypeptidase regulatory-like domain-containing protein [Acidobacteria bacterium]|nr:carboxypeptidase regulatory-like domain-containing protein [Acidobacteriota bacterium]